MSGTLTVINTTFLMNTASSSGGDDVVESSLCVLECTIRHEEQTMAMSRIAIATVLYFYIQGVWLASLAHTPLLCHNSLFKIVPLVSSHNHPS